MAGLSERLERQMLWAQSGYSRTGEGTVDSVYSTVELAAAVLGGLARKQPTNDDEAVAGPRIIY